MNEASLRDPILSVCHKDFTLLRTHETVDEVLGHFRENGLPHKIIYLYVVDEQDKLLGVLPIRRLLASRPEMIIGEIYLKKIISLRDTLTLGEARGAFAEHKFLAFPVVDESNVVRGIIDIERFAGDLGDVSARTSFDDIYALFGFDPTLGLTGSARKRFTIRFPWLMATIGSGSLAALLTSQFELTLQKAIGLAFFLTLVLGLNESVSMQSTAFSIHALHNTRPTLGKYLAALKKELLSGLMLGLACGLCSGVIAFLWRGDFFTAVSVAISLVVTIAVSCVWGLSVPFLLNALQKDPKVAAHSLVLALTDLSTLFLYFSIGYLLVG